MVVSSRVKTPTISPIIRRCGGSRYHARPVAAPWRRRDLSRREGRRYVDISELANSWV